MDFDFSLKIKAKDWRYEIPVQLVSYPGCCGIRILRSWSVISSDYLPTKYHQELADIVTAALAAKKLDELPKDVKIYQNIFTGTRYEYQEAAYTWINHACKMGIIKIADAVWGEAQNEDNFSLYKLGVLGGWTKGTTVRNPNSGRDICTFELHKDYTSASKSAPLATQYGAPPEEFAVRPVTTRTPAAPTSGRSAST